ncbi:MAG: magnesium transporter [Pirellulaceae bacterium]
MEKHPWEQLGELVESGTVDEVDQFLESLPAGETARAVSRLSEEEQTRLLTRHPADQAVELIQGVSEAQAAELIQLLPPADAAAIVDQMESDERADLLAELGDKEAEAILAEMDPAEAADVRHLVRYEAETAGGLMITEYLCYTDDQTVRDVLDDLRANAEQYTGYYVQYAYVVGAGQRTEDSPGVLTGVLRLRDLLLSPSHRPISEIMIRDPLAVRVGAELDELMHFFDRHHFFGVPVIDAENRLVGVVCRHDVEEALAGRADDDILKLQGIVGEELRTMPLSVRAGHRLTWLSANIVLNLIAVSVIAFYEATLEAVIALAVFLPLISDMGGNAGVQAIAVSIRELSLGLLKPYELMWVALKEASVGLVNGLVLGILVGLAGWIWQRNVYLGLVVGGAMMLNTVIATIVGGAMPLILKRFNVDPALASGPLLTTVTDMTGFFLVLSFATFALSRLV